MPEDAPALQRLELSFRTAVAKAQAAIGEVVFTLLGLVDALQGIHAGLPPPANVDDRHEHRRPFDVATEVLATIECVLEATFARRSRACSARHR